MFSNRRTLIRSLGNEVALGSATVAIADRRRPCAPRAQTPAAPASVNTEISSTFRRILDGRPCLSRAARRPFSMGSHETPRLAAVQVPPAGPSLASLFLAQDARDARDARGKRQGIREDPPQMTIDTRRGSEEKGIMPEAPQDPFSLHTELRAAEAAPQLRQR